MLLGDDDREVVAVLHEVLLPGLVQTAEVHVVGERVALHAGLTSSHSARVSGSGSPARTSRMRSRAGSVIVSRAVSSVMCTMIRP